MMDWIKVKKQTNQPSKVFWLKQLEEWKFYLLRWGRIWKEYWRQKLGVGRGESKFHFRHVISEMPVKTVK